MPRNHSHHASNTTEPTPAADTTAGGTSNQAANQGGAVGFNSYTPSHLASATQRAVHRTPAAHAAAAHAQSGQDARGGAFGKVEASSSSFNQTSLSLIHI